MSGLRSPVVIIGRYLILTETASVFLNFQFTDEWKENELTNEWIDGYTLWWF